MAGFLESGGLHLNHKLYNGFIMHSRLFLRHLLPEFSEVVLFGVIVAFSLWHIQMFEVWRQLTSYGAVESSPQLISVLRLPWVNTLALMLFWAVIGLVLLSVHWAVMALVVKIRNEFYLAFGYTHGKDELVQIAAIRYGQLLAAGVTGIVALSLSSTYAYWAGEANSLSAPIIPVLCWLVLTFGYVLVFKLIRSVVALPAFVSMTPTAIERELFRDER